MEESPLSQSIRENREEAIEVSLTTKRQTEAHRIQRRNRQRTSQEEARFYNELIDDTVNPEDVESYIERKQETEPQKREMYEKIKEMFQQQNNYKTV